MDKRFMTAGVSSLKC